MENRENKDLSLPPLERPLFDAKTFSLFLATSLPLLSVLLYITLGTPSTAESILLGLLVATPCLFFNFSVIHEAAHRNITRNRRLNDWIGRIGTFWLLGSFRHFRWVHLEHHAHTNQEGLDPDLHAAGKINFLKWCFTAFHYFLHVCKNAKRAKMKATDFVPYFLSFALVGYGIFTGKAFAFLVVWVIPSLVSVGFMVFCFDYLPHRPHKDTCRYKSSVIRIVPGWIEAILMGQNYHLIHHLWPSIPWHQYRSAYELRKKALENVGARIVHGFEEKI
jgi:beta-carotene hydroxylase